MLHEIGNLKERFAVVHHQANNVLLKSLSYSTGTHTTWIHEHALVHEEQAECEIVSLQGKLIIDYILSNDESLLKHHNQPQCSCDHLSRLFLRAAAPVLLFRYFHSAMRVLTDVSTSTNTVQDKIWACNSWTIPVKAVNRHRHGQREDRPDVVLPFSALGFS